MAHTNQNIQIHNSIAQIISDLSTVNTVHARETKSRRDSDGFNCSKDTQ